MRVHHVNTNLLLWIHKIKLKYLFNKTNQKQNSKYVKVNEVEIQMYVNVLFVIVIVITNHFQI